MTTKRRPSAAAAAALVVATLLLLAQAAPSATAATPATSSKHNSNNKNKAGPSGLAACTKATGVPGCVACVPAGGGGHKSAAAKKFTCTRCEGAGYETKPVKGVCSCSIGYGRLPLSPATSSSSSAAPAPAHSGGKSSGGKSSGKGGKKKTTPTPTLAPCSPCPQGTVSGSFSDNCVACAAGYEPYGGASCVAACTPFSSCAEAGASCGPVDNGCGTGVLECGSCASGQTCDSVVRRCACPDGSLPPADTPSSCPLGGARLSCASDAECASSICDSQVCVDACPPNSQPAAGSSDGCVCSPDSFSLSIGGKPPCAACGGGSFAPTPGSARCECAPPRVWSKPLNGCACQTSGEAYVNGECRMTGDPLEGSAECTTDGQCASADCDATLNPAACSPKLCADGTAPSGDSGACLCAPGTWSANGQAPCFPCGAGASSAAYGSTFCTCQNPIGSAWSQTAATGGRCLCPDGRVPTLLTPKSIPVCLLKTGEDCAASSSCASGICEVSSGSCIDQCPPNATLDVAAGRCRCIVNYFGAATGGDADCSPCTGDATTNGLTGQTACSCPPGKGTWSLSGACVCGPGEQKQPSTGLCLAGDLRLCERNEQCASNVCETATGICGDAPEAPPCPPNSEPDGSGSCRCLPGSFGDGATCTRCGAGSYAPLAGSAACECSSPVGSIWSLSTNSCACLDGQTVVNGECLVSTGGSCPSGDACASALCSGGVCVAACPPGSEAVGGSCVCSVGYYSSTGEPSCVACGGGSLNVGTGNTACRCNPTTGEVWNHLIARCECPLNQELSAGRCRGVDGQTCGTRDDCVSATCLQSVCRSPCTPPQIFDSSGNCVCPRGTFGASCTPCGAGATTSASGASACLCDSPQGSTWTGSITNTCACAVGSVATDGVCKLAPGESCSSGYSCSTGLCDQGKCVASCPAPGSEPDGVGGCRCRANYFGVQGKTPCSPCGSGATSAPGSATCTCPSPATWSAAHGCTCAAGFSWSGTACTCLATTCSPLCPGAASPSCAQGSACDGGQCLPAAGSKCINANGFCGVCQKSCGNTLADVCSSYDLPTSNKECQISAVGGGGRCAGTNICCSVTYPYYISPSPATGLCP